MRALLVLGLLVTACASGRKEASRATAPRVGAALEAAQVDGALLLPAGLAVDPTTLPRPRAEVSPRRPARLELPNGLVVFLVEDHATPLVLVRALLPFGAVDDPPERLGLAALTAELLTEGGAGELGAEALDELLEGRGADASSGAADEYAQVTLSVRARDLATLFPVFADLLQRPRLEPARLTVLRGRALEAVRRRGDQPDAVASRALSKAVFGANSLLAREPLAQHLEAISAADVQRLAAARVGPRGAQLVISGDFDPAAVRTLVSLHLGAWQGAAPAPRAWPSPPQLSRRVILVPRELPQAKIRIGTRGFARGAPEEHAARLVAAALGSFGVGRLPRELRDERGLAYAAFAQVSPGPTTGLFVAGVDTRPGQAAEAVRVALSVLGAAGGGAPLSETELETAVDMALNAFAFRFDTAARVGLERALLAQLGYPPDHLDTFRQRTEAVTLEEARQLARRFAADLQIVVVGPRSLEAALAAFGPVSVISDVDQFR